MQRTLCQRAHPQQPAVVRAFSTCNISAQVKVRSLFRRHFLLRERLKRRARSQELVLFFEGRTIPMDVNRMRPRIVEKKVAPQFLLTSLSLLGAHVKLFLPLTPESKLLPRHTRLHCDNLRQSFLSCSGMASHLVG
jgi:hypothetical protein